MPILMLVCCHCSAQMGDCPRHPAGPNQQGSAVRLTVRLQPQLQTLRRHSRPMPAGLIVSSSVHCGVQTRAPSRLLCRSDKSVIVWELSGGSEDRYGEAKRALRGHSHFVQDVVISSDGQFCLTGSWDGTLRLWDLNTGQTTRRFVGHEKDVLSVAFSVDNRQVCSQQDSTEITCANQVAFLRASAAEQGCGQVQAQDAAMVSVRVLTCADCVWVT